MDTQDLNQVISTDIDAFYQRSISPQFTDAYLNQFGYKSVNDVKKGIRQSPTILHLYNSFLSNYYLLKGEYVVCYSNSTTIITNYRLFILEGNTMLSLPLSSILSYQQNGSSVVTTYLLDGKEKKYYANEGIIESYVNNALQKHSDSVALFSSIQLDAITLNKLEISKKYTISLGNEFIPEKVFKPVNFRGIAVLLLFLTCFGGCYYMIDSSEEDTSTNHTTSNQYCSKHDVTYSPNNAYGGCPKCVKEKQAKDAADAMERKIYGR